MRSEKHATKQHNLNFAHASATAATTSATCCCNTPAKKSHRNPVASLLRFESIRFALNENEIIALLTMSQSLPLRQQWVDVAGG